MILMSFHYNGDNRAIPCRVKLLKWKLEVYDTCQCSVLNLNSSLILLLGVTIFSSIKTD